MDARNTALHLHQSCSQGLSQRKNLLAMLQFLDIEAGPHSDCYL